MNGDVEIEFVGGPQDGNVISIEIPPFAGGAPMWIQFPTGVQPSADAAPGEDAWPPKLSPGTLVDRYRAPSSHEELRAAMTAYAEGRAVKYRYAGQEMF